MTNPHNHTHCIAQAMATAEQQCGAKLTPLRRQVLATLWHSHQARGAYDILAQMNAGAAKPLAPLSVYRALDYLVAQGLAHRIESLNAFIGCPHAVAHPHALQFLVCTQCHHVTELHNPALDTALAATAQAAAFTPNRTVIEVLGLCAACKGA